MSQPGLFLDTTNSAASTNAKNIKAAAGDIRSISVMNASAALKYLRLYNKATAPVPGTDTPAIVIALPATSSKEIDFSLGKPFSLGIGMAITGAAAVLDATAVAVGDVQVAIAYI
jgi:hypothetical protein